VCKIPNAVQAISPSIKREQKICSEDGSCDAISRSILILCFLKIRDNKRGRLTAPFI
jgi:hypothetical protein